jgi:putative two-component system response regulator
VQLREAGYVDVRGTSDPTTVPELVRSAPPEILLLDLHMPQLDGFALMQLLEPSISSGEVSVLMLTADASREARRRALSLGARDFLTKPLDPIEVELRVRNLLETRQLQRQLQSHNTQLRERVEERTDELERAQHELLDRLARVCEYRDYATAEHTRRVGQTARLLAERTGLAADIVATIAEAAPLHDIGKLAVPDSILLKAGPLTDQEWDQMRAHVKAGAEILGGSHSSVLRLGEEIAQYHHERWDGTGYDARLAGEDIPISGRITAIADVFDALTHDRPYKPALPVPVAVAEIHRQAGLQFDPNLVSLFAALEHDALV